jgi:hypothetical protein
MGSSGKFFRHCASEFIDPQADGSGCDVRLFKERQHRRVSRESLADDAATPSNGSTSHGSSHRSLDFATVRFASAATALSLRATRAAIRTSSDAARGSCARRGCNPARANGGGTCEPSSVCVFNAAQSNSFLDEAPRGGMNFIRGRGLHGYAHRILKFSPANKHKYDVIIRLICGFTQKSEAHSSKC